MFVKRYRYLGLTLEIEFEFEFDSLLGTELDPTLVSRIAYGSRQNFNAFCSRAALVDGMGWDRMGWEWKGTLIWASSIDQYMIKC